MSRLLSSLLLALLLLPAAALAEEEAVEVEVPPEEADEQRTLFGSETVELGGFGGPLVKLTDLGDETALLVGGRGGFLLGDAFWFGGGGLGLATGVELARAPGESEAPVSFGYGGPMVGLVLFSDALVHAEVNALVGAGSIGFERTDGDTDSDGLFVLEPEANLELNVFPFFRLAAGLSWRFVSGVDTGDWENRDFGGLGGQLLAKFGSF